jgi:hypothetical protein
MMKKPFKKMYRYCTQPVRRNYSQNIVLCHSLRHASALNFSINSCGIQYGKESLLPVKL